MTFRTALPEDRSFVWGLASEDPVTGTSAESETQVPMETFDASQGWRLWSPAQEWEIKWPVICRHYAVKDASAAGALAFERHYLLDSLLDAYSRLRSFFGPASEFQLDSTADPDVGEKRYLRVSIITDLPVAEALTRMDRFAEDWWLDHIARAGRDLVFVVEFR